MPFVIDLANIFLGKHIEPKLYDLPRQELVFDEDFGQNIVFKYFFGICVALEIENTSSTTDLVYTIDSRDGTQITLAPQSTKGYDRTQIKSLHIISGDTWKIRAQIVRFEDIISSR